MESPSSDRSDEWRELRTLFSAYLHQDFIDDFGDEWNAVRQYCAHATTSHVLAAADALKDILVRFHDETQLREISDRLGSSYYPPGVGKTYRGWMTELEQFLLTASTALKAGQPRTAAPAACCAPAPSAPEVRRG